MKHASLLGQGLLRRYDTLHCLGCALLTYWGYVQSKPEVGGEFSLFGGGVVGKYTSVEKPTNFVQSWKLKSPTWPEGTHSKSSY